jgi:hypothetical protein
MFIFVDAAKPLALLTSFEVLSVVMYDLACPNPLLAVLASPPSWWLSPLGSSSSPQHQ